MPRYSAAYSEFIQRCDEVLLLIRRAAQIERSRSAFGRGKEIDALCRGALVLLSSHIEAYIKELGECLLDAIFSKKVCRSKLAKPFFYYVTKRNLDRIRRGNEPNQISIDVFDFLQNRSAVWDFKGAIPNPIDIEEFNIGFSNPKFDKIKGYLARFGYIALRHDINKSLKGEALVILGNLDQIVDIRNAISHGEASATKTPSEVRALINSAVIFCRTVDVEFGDWCKKNICTIR
jgi:hypothetical protein